MVDIGRDARRSMESVAVGTNAAFSPEHAVQVCRASLQAVIYARNKSTERKKKPVEDSGEAKSGRQNNTEAGPPQLRWICTSRRSVLGHVQ